MPYDRITSNIYIYIYDNIDIDFEFNYYDMTNFQYQYYSDENNKDTHPLYVISKKINGQLFYYRTYFL